jgi:glycosyltransferase involved in cell wall biosynthesis
VKIVHLNSSYITGGAARAAFRLHTGLHRLGHDSSMFVARRQSFDPTVTTFAPPVGLVNSLRRGLRRRKIRRSFARYRTSRPAGYESFSDDRTMHGSTLLSQLPACDVINLHWIGGFVDYQAFFVAAPQHTPVVWTLHDMNPFTGGCHYDHGCGRYTQGCGICPQLGSRDAADLSHRIWQRKREVFTQIEPGRLHIVATSQWMAATVQCSALLGSCPVTVIPLGLDVDDFAPRDRCLARAVLGVPHDARVLLFAAESLNNRRKGFSLLAQALAGLGDAAKLCMVSLGQSRPTLDSPLPHVHLGYISNDRLLSLVYSAADVFVCPSLQEAFGQTALEAMACGTPVVGFAVGGIPDIVRHGVSGLLVPPQDVVALRAAIVDLLRDAAGRAEMSVNCRRIAVEEYTLEAQARRYIELYERVGAKPEKVTESLQGGVLRR